MEEQFSLEQELLDLEASDKELAVRNPKRLLDFLIMVEEYVWSKGLKRLELYSITDPSIKFKVEGKKVYREVHKGGSCYREEHLESGPIGLPIYHLRIEDNLEKIPSLV